MVPLTFTLRVCHGLFLMFATGVGSALVEQPPHGELPSALQVLLRDAPLELDASKLLEETVLSRLKTASSFSAEANKEFVNRTKQLLEVLRQSTLESSSSSQGLIKQRLDMEEACEKKRTEGLNRAMNYKLWYEGNSTLHQECRGEEERLWKKQLKCISALQTQQSKYSKMEKELKDFMVIKKPSNCKLLDNETDMVYITRLRDAFVQELDTFVLMKRQFDRISESTKGNESYCQLVTSTYEERKATCDAIGRHMDGNSCQRAYFIQETCSFYAGTCYPRVQSDYDEVKAIVKAQEKVGKRDFASIARTDCYLGVFDGISDAKIQACANQAANTTSLDIELGNMPEMSECRTTPMYPCTAEYLEKEYNDLPDNAKGKCNSCSGMLKV